MSPPFLSPPSPNDSPPRHFLICFFLPNSTPSMLAKLPLPSPSWNPREGPNSLFSCTLAIPYPFLVWWLNSSQGHVDLIMLHPLKPLLRFLLHIKYKPSNFGPSDQNKHSHHNPAIIVSPLLATPQAPWLLLSSGGPSLCTFSDGPSPCRSSLFLLQESPSDQCDSQAQILLHT